MNYLNEYDPQAARWLQNLVDAGEIPESRIDARSIKDVQPADLEGFDQCHFFAGVGGWCEALRLAGVPSTFPLWTGSCPCQSVSGAGKRKGEKDERHLWPEFYRLISECRPAIILGEQTASGDGREWLDGISLDLEELDYAVGSSDLCAASGGAPHPRQRLWWMAYNGSSPSRNIVGLAFSEHGGREGRQPERGGASSALPPSAWSRFTIIPMLDGKQRRIESGSFPLAHGLPRSVGPGSTRGQRMELMAAKNNRTCRLRGYGNAIVPQLAAQFIRAAFEALAPH